MDAVNLINHPKLSHGHDQQLIIFWREHTPVVPFTLTYFLYPVAKQKGARSPAMNVQEEQQNVSPILGSAVAGLSAMVTMY
jgi:hypothetical protein